jgi:hypothetical protein
MPSPAAMEIGTFGISSRLKLYFCCTYAQKVQEEGEQSEQTSLAKEAERQTDREAENGCRIIALEIGALSNCFFDATIRVSFSSEIVLVE